MLKSIIAARHRVVAAPVTPVNPTSTNLVEWWPYDNNTDGSHASINGIRVGATYNAVDQVGGTHCLDFDGASDQVRTNGISDTIHTGDFSAGGWFWLNTTAETEGLLGIWESTTATKHWSIIYNSSSNRFEFTIADSSGTLYTASGAYNTTGAWVHVMAVRESDTLKIYVDKTLGSVTDDVSGITENTGSVTYMRLGRVDGNPDLDGKADEINLWNDALTEAEVVWLYNGNLYADL